MLWKKSNSVSINGTIILLILQFDIDPTSQHERKGEDVKTLRHQEYYSVYRDTNDGFGLHEAIIVLPLFAERSMRINCRQTTMTCEARLMKRRIEGPVLG